MEVPEHETGAHWWLLITKRGQNTRDVIRALADLSSAKPRQIGYAGLKDRHAVTSQWFSLPIETLDPSRLKENLPDSLKLLEYRRARHAIRRGGLKGNRFTLRLRTIKGDYSVLDRRLERLRQGVPNYFGSQRFGHNGGNLIQARALFRGLLDTLPRFERGLYLSAARAHLFNLVLGERVAHRSWDQIMDGEAVILHGTRSWFSEAEGGETLAQRLQSFDIHPSGPLVGLGETAVNGACRQLEDEVMEREPGLSAGLIHWRMRAERRALRLIPEQLDWNWDENDLIVRFQLPKGTFATAVLRELVVPA